VQLQTVQYAVADHVATITLDRPDVLNAFNRQMCEEFTQIWAEVRRDDDVRCLVLRANGERAFSSGLDQAGPRDPDDPWSADPAAALAAKRAGVWKPLIVAVHGMAVGGAFAWLNDADVIIAAEDATFFDPHLDIGIVTSHTAMGMVRAGIPLREALRVALFSMDERMSAAQARQIGLVSEVLPREQLWPRAAELASLIASKPPAAVQASLQRIWTSLEEPGELARERGLAASHAVNPIARAQRQAEPRIKHPWTLR
jgi:enoyl-CoA hydratase/carnithine racemase